MINNTPHRNDYITYSGSVYRYADTNGFMDTIRDVPYLASNLGYNFQDIDISLFNYKSGKFGFCDLKCRNSMPKFAQTAHLSNLSKSMATSPNFIGIYCIQQIETHMDSGSFIRRLNDNLWNLVMNKDQGCFEYTKEQVFKFIKNCLD